MHTQTIRTGLTAAMTAGRALLAAGWRYDSTTPMADDTTIRTLLHPTGREIHARTDDRDGDTTSLTMTGLSLEQVAGAVRGAGLHAAPDDAGDIPSATEALKGPWQAVLTDDYGFVLDNLDDSSPEDEVRISIRRGSALPTERHGNLRLPGTCLSGDVIDLWDDLYVEDGDPSTDAPARWVQAQAMADGLNAACRAGGPR